MSSISPNMLLVIPDPQVTPGPEWAQLLVDALERIDEHDHSADMGVALSIGSLTVDGDLSLQSYNLTDIRTLRLNTQVSTPVTANDLQIIYSEGGELFYRDDAGNAVQITNNGSLAGTAGTIANLGVGGSSANYNDTSKTFTFLYSPAKPGRFAHGDLDLYPYDGLNSYTNNVTLKVNTTLGVDYDLTLPDALPGSTSVLTVSATGQMAVTRALSVDSVTATIVTGTTVLAGAGLLATPGFAFSADTNTGFWSPGSGEIAVASDGVHTMQFGDHLTMLNTATIYIQDGTASDPGLRFFTDGDTGLYYNAGTPSMNFAFAGGSMASISATGLGALITSGSVGSPALAFFADQNTGLYYDAGVRVSVDGSSRLTIGPSESSFTGVVNASGGINTAGGGAFKVKLISVGTSSAASGLLSAAHGLDPTKIRSIAGSIYNGTTGEGFSSPGGTQFVPQSDILWDATNVSISFGSFSANSKDFYATITYVD